MHSVRYTNEYETGVFRMSQHTPPGTPSGPQGHGVPPYYPPPGYYAPPPPPPQVVKIVAKSGGFRSAIMWLLAMAMFFGIFVIGVIIGIAAMKAAPNVVLREHYRDGKVNNAAIAVIPIIGAIDAHQASFVREAVNDVINDGWVKAVVLRVDSPGGGVSPSDEIWYQIERLKKAGYPVVASYGGVAASGGYYVSCATDHIVAEPTCVTGSIGVIAQVMTMEQLMEKIGVTPVTLVAEGSPDKDVANNMFREWNDDDRAKLGKMLDSAYITFRDRVKNGRKEKISDSAKLDKVADGSIFTAYEAQANGLIDEVGYLDDAIAVAEKLAKVSAGGAEVFVVREPPSLFGDQLFVANRSPNPMAGLDAERIRSLLTELAAPRVAYLMH